MQQSFTKYTAQMMIKDVSSHHPKVVQHFFVGAADKKYQIWERNSLSIEIHSDEVMLQKLNYIHYNPVKAGVCLLPKDYHYYSASFYIENKTL